MAAKQILLVASTGGHLEELYTLRGLLVKSETPMTWVTFDSPQSRSLLAGESDVVFVGRVASRGYRDLLRTFVPALRILRKVRPTTVFSTGAGIALTFLPFAWLVGARATYVESAARTHGPSWTGRILGLMPWIRLRTQYQLWATRRWTYSGSVFDGYISAPARNASGVIHRVVVTLGTQEGFPFTSLVDRVRQIAPAGTEIRWQLGPDYPVSKYPPGAAGMVPRDELETWMDAADVIIAHAGVGSALMLLNRGRTPVLVPRSAARGEHIDEHQQLIADVLVRRELAVCASPLELTWEDLVAATKTRTERREIRAESGLVTRSQES